MSNHITYRFSGHDTFHCRPLWLKKGFDFVNKGKLFNDNDSVVDLGVGKNMVGAIKFWMRAFGFYNLQTNKIEGLAPYIFDKNGFDPFLENEGTLFLLHYLLIKNWEVSSIYNLVFTKLIKEKQEFTKDNLYSFIRTECVKEDVDFNINTLNNDIKVFLKNYVPSTDKKESYEDSFNGLFYDLRLINKIQTSAGEQKYRFNIDSRKQLPTAIFFYVLLDTFNDISISFESIYDRVSRLFLMHKEGTYDKIIKLEKDYPDLVIFKDDGGRKEVQIKEGINKLDILRRYYDAV